MRFPTEIGNDYIHKENNLWFYLLELLVLDWNKYKIFILYKSSFTSILICLYHKKNILSINYEKTTDYPVTLCIYGTIKAASYTPLPEANPSTYCWTIILHTLKAFVKKLKTITILFFTEYKLKVSSY